MSDSWLYSAELYIHSLILFSTKNPTMSNRRAKRFWNRFLIMFLCYAIIIPSLYFLLDNKSANDHWKNDAGDLLLATSGIAIIIALIIASWWKTDPELKRW